jgi:hypothetical protein
MKAEIGGKWSVGVSRYCTTIGLEIGSSFWGGAWDCWTHKSSEFVQYVCCSNILFNIQVKTVPQSYWMENEFHKEKLSNTFVPLCKLKNQPDATIYEVYWLNMFRAPTYPSSGVQIELLVGWRYMPAVTPLITLYCLLLEPLHCNTLYHNTRTHSFVSLFRIGHQMW